MSRPQPGTYAIYNRVASATGELLAMTFNGDQQPISVTPLDLLNPRQHWVIKNYNHELQHIRPQEHQELEAGWGEAIFTLPVGNYVWNITDNEGYVIKDGGRSVMWTINQAVAETLVIPVTESTGEKQRWVFRPIASPPSAN